MCSQLTPDTIDQWFADSVNMTTQEISEKIQRQPEEVEVTNEETGIVEKETHKTLKFKGPEEIIESIESGLMLARDNLLSTSGFYETIDDVPELLGLEFAMAHFVTGADLEGNAANTLENSIRILEDLHGVELEVKNES